MDARGLPVSERKRGRPKKFDGVVSVRLPKALHDELSLEALHRKVDLAQVIRERLSKPFSYLKKRRPRRAVHNRSIRPSESGLPRQATCAIPDVM